MKKKESESQQIEEDINLEVRLPKNGLNLQETKKFLSQEENKEKTKEVIKS